MTDDAASGRRLCAVLWGCLVAFALAGFHVRSGSLLILAWFGSVAMIIISVVTARTRAEERLVQPRAYRAIAATLFAVMVAGVVVGLLPGAPEMSQLGAVYFGLIGVLAYRALVARRPGPALSTAFVAIVTWLPVAFVRAVGHHRLPPGYGPRVIAWQEHATGALVKASVLLLGVLVAAALVAFVPRRDELPDARVVRSGS
jgi:hypothetical protein